MSDVPQKKPLKATLNLPETAFAMKANLPQNEPARLEAWQKAGLYEQIRTARAGAPKFILHDGPPYANGAIHLGHALNKCIKDFVVKTKTMAGFDAPYVPGWDCHGLPIEIKVDEQLGRKKLEMPALSVRRACREYAEKYVTLQKSQFERIGVFGRWNDPYKTMSFGYEAAIVETFYEFFEQGFVYKGLKPVFWCIHDQTALAEAEVEYEMHTSPSIYVRYKLTSEASAISEKLAGKDVWTIIWTTTPWTIPASMAVAYNPEMEYVAAQATLASGEIGVYVVAGTLLEAVAKACGFTDVEVLERFNGIRMEGAQFAHPFFARTVVGVTADYVTADQGTGAVHTSPAHGVDDFYTGKRYGIPDVQYVDNAGRQRNLPQQEAFDGLTVFESNKPITELLREKGALLSGTFFEHSYPHCWRCHNPVIVRATEQWFISMETPMPTAEAEIAAAEEVDGSEPTSQKRDVEHPVVDGMTTFRQRALDEIKRVVWDPAWGEERISNMIATRPDWCISRQRIWGVPIAVFLCNKCHEPLNDADVNKSIVELFKKESADAWYKYSAAELLPDGVACSCGNTDKNEFRKEMDILDVWFESGASWHAVLDAEESLRFPADLYTEGGDQHRGWFHSSLLTSVALRGVAPYRMVATSGWTLDEQGRAFSKSLGNGVDPVDVAKRLGAEIIRLWVASVDFREDVAASENLMQRVGDNYRKLRNTLKFLLGNLHDFDPAKDALPFADLEQLDQYILAQTAELVAKIRKAYDEFEFHRAYHALNEFVNTDLSALYLDVLKDRLYTFAPDHPERRSAQTALWRIAEALVRLIAPILSFTADEAWAFLPKVEGRESSVHLALFPDLSDIVPGSEAAIEHDWEQLLELRAQVMAKLEVLRAAKSIGKSLEAKVTLTVVIGPGPSPLRLLDQYTTALAELFNVSEVDVLFVESALETPSFEIEVQRSAAPKCERCWRYIPEVGEDDRFPTVCLRCADALEAIGFEPYQIPPQDAAGEGASL
ncbi:isoleucine--tRNA ligase [Granulicella tundricola]|uniref:Isoleucine--tRNA ligase n=1 Tax=Granulicella tundricola (strain ATCC BAA-1859 / DSM 23138 / MP5ACTX9) TaxID=1198114 RepID=E8WWX7_GRATM|nr:isoleucine--tRNA ligase [Granulicella tundricola]ADW68538.1 isoleucyl-tRNA synthetase [Granulicella tundricola MP5ACTX9]